MSQKRQILEGANLTQAWFETEAHRKSLIQHLRGRHIPSKFAFAGSAASWQISYADDYPNEYLDGRAEHEAAIIASLLKADSPRQICDIGPGNGVHTAQFVNLSKSLGISFDRYLAIDFSETLLRAVRRRLETCLPPSRTFLCWDIEQNPSNQIRSWRGQSPVLMCTFGNTLGNLASQQLALRNVFQSCQKNDILAVGVYVRRDEVRENLIESYSTPLVYNAIREPFRAIGLLDGAYEMNTKYVNGDIFITAHMREEKEIEGVHLETGEEIRCFISRRYTQGDLKSMLLETGWSILGGDLSPDRAYLVLLARRM